MVSVKDVDQTVAVEKIAEFLKKSGKINVPSWIDLVKSARHKELAPNDSDFFYVKSASLARHLYFRKPVGVGAFKKVYGGNRRRGSRPNHFSKASGSIIRKALQALEEIKWVEKNANGGRQLSQQGRRDLDRLAFQIISNKE
ncbi:40S ribosomal protein S19-like protein [Aphelenchoides besseyi]|nr:40S ribosomal protein S19-like protein [Aphelenchoides besseyi]KAI6207930.1 40S ribosomal protein S19-like protein [Aphelenchoides besseyi]